MKKKNKKIAAITGIAVGIIIAGSFGTFKTMENANDYEAKQAAIENGTMKEYKESKKNEEQTKKIVSGLVKSTGIGPGSDEDMVISAMHKMTHQKIKAEDKWGAIPMTPENIQEIKIALESTDYRNGSALMGIISKWEQGDFNTVARDHNSLWSMQGGTIGKAYGTMTAEEERIFIENNFK